MRDILAGIWLLGCSMVMVASGCAQWTLGSKAVAEEGAVVADEVRGTAEFTLCKAITIGAWVRAYGSDPVKAEAWRQLCSVMPKETPAK